MTRPLPAQHVLRRILDYNWRTGEFTWRVRPEMPIRWNRRFAGKKAGNVNTRGYVTIAINHVAYLAHRLGWKIATGEEPSEIDHFDRNPTNNALENLRAATRSENLRNRAPYKKRKAA